MNLLVFRSTGHTNTRAVEHTNTRAVEQKITATTEIKQLDRCRYNIAEGGENTKKDRLNLLNKLDRKEHDKIPKTRKKPSKTPHFQQYCHTSDTFTFSRSYRTAYRTHLAAVGKRHNKAPKNGTENLKNGPKNEKQISSNQVIFLSGPQNGQVKSTNTPRLPACSLSKSALDTAHTISYSLRKTCLPPLSCAALIPPSRSIQQSNAGRWNSLTLPPPPPEKKST